MFIKFKRLNEDAKLPVKMTSGSAGFDLFTVDDHDLVPNETYAISLGFAMELPEGYEAQIRSRSGMALKHEVVVLNGVGTIDEDWRGENKVILHNFGNKTFKIHNGDRVAQMVIGKVIDCVFEEVDELSSTERGEGGFGSTGTK